MTSSKAAAAAIVGLVGLTLTAGPGAQVNTPVPPSEYARWESLAVQPRASATGPLSPDGKWLVYGITRQNRDNELRVVDLAGGKETVLALGEQPSFSSDSTWLAYAIGVTEAEEDTLQKARKPVHRKIGILNLASAQTVTIDDIESFAFSADGSHLAMRAYPPEPPRREGNDSSTSAGDAEERDKPGSSLIVRRLATGVDTTFGNVTEFTWQSKGPLLAFVVGVEGRRGNGVQLYNVSTGALRVLDSGEAAYANLTWRKDAGDLVVMRSKSDASRDGSTEVLLAWHALEQGGERRSLDPTASAVLPAAKRIVAFRRPEWSQDGRIVFVGTADWDASVEKKKPGDDADEAAGVDIWHWKDIEVMPLQKKRIATDRQRSLLAAWHVESGALVPLAKTLHEDVRLLEGQPRAVIVDRAPYAMERSIGRPHADISLIDLQTGARTPVKQAIEERYLQSSPDGRFLLYLLDDQYWLYDIANGSHRNLTKTVATSFVDKQADVTIKQKPAYGVGGWTTAAASVLLYDRYDIWEIPTVPGGAPLRLTEGAAEQLEHRVVRLDPDDRFIDRTRPVHVQLYGEWSKRFGFARILPGASKAERPLFLDKRVNRLTKAKHADVLAYVVDDFDDSPDYFVVGPSLTDGRQVTHTNPVQTKYAWGRSELIEYKNSRGERMQGALFYPAGYEPGRKYPMVVYMYEMLSDTVHNYVSPSERAPYNASVFTSQGYVFFTPDIVFRPREPGVSVADCVVAGVKAVIQKGIVDPARVGTVGHSWGGFDSTYLATHNDGIFAAAVAGAPITNLVSNYGNHHWSSGIAETDHIETGQQRMEVPLWEDLPAYIRNSAVYGAHTMKTPLLIEVGDSDGTVFWHQGVELYNVARRAGKPVVLLQYAGEDHGLRKRQNQIDYHQRILQWFGHYLKGEPAQPWIERGVTALERERELKKAKPSPPKSSTTTSG